MRHGELAALAREDIDLANGTVYVRRNLNALVMLNEIQKPYYSLGSIGCRWNAAVKRAGIRRRNPYHTRHTFACWLLSAGANPSFIANPMGHENAQMVYEIYATWIEEMNSEQVAMLNRKLAL